MKKLLYGVAGLVILSLLTVGVLLYQYPYLPAIIDEGFPSWKWPAKGIYVKVTGEPVAWPQKEKLSSTSQSPTNSKLLTLIKESETDALLAYHKGKLKFAYYRPDLAPDTQFNSYSMAKSLIGFLVLKAIDEGEIDGLDSPIGNYLLTLKDENLRKLPIEKFLTMRSGLLFEQKKVSKPLARDAKRPQDKDASNPFTPLARTHIEGLASAQPLLKLPADPKFDYHYQNINSALLGAMLTAIYKKPLNEILSEKIWKPAGASHARWRTYTQDGAVTPYCCLFAKARDWGKVGIFLAHNGSQANPFLSEHTRKLINAHRYDKSLLVDGVYGLHVRHDVLDRKGEPLQGPFTYFIGHGGQLVYLKPENDLVVVRFGRRHTLLHSTLYFLWREILETDRKTAGAH